MSLITIDSLVMRDWEEMENVDKSLHKLEKCHNVYENLVSNFIPYIKLSVSRQHVMKNGMLEV
jgi:hypothetical protein